MSRRPELGFLPAVLEIQETPPSPIGRAILWGILLVFLAASAWATIGEVDIVAVARGRVIPGGYVKKVQPLERGTVTAVHVAEGQRVSAGELLIQLDSASADADVERIRSDRDAAQREESRYRQLSNWLGGEILPAPQDPKTTDDPVLAHQRKEFLDRLGVLQGEHDRLLAEKDTARQQVDKLEAVLPIITRRARDQKDLSERKLLAEQQFLETEQQRLVTLHDLRTQRSRVGELDVGIREISARIEYARSEFHREVLQRLEEAQNARKRATQELKKARSRLEAKQIMAPVDGVIQQLAVHNVGAVVTPAQELMVIVPHDAPLEVEAYLENKDIGFVEAGQAAEIKVDAFPFTRYGTVSGKVRDLSSDAVSDDRLGLVYRMRVATERPQIEVNGRVVSLGPGMTVTVELKTGTRRLIEYFLSPLLRYRDESVRER